MTDMNDHPTHAPQKISVIGLGYVGLPLAIALAPHYAVVGFDVDTNSRRPASDYFVCYFFHRFHSVGSAPHDQIDNLAATARGDAVLVSGDTTGDIDPENCFTPVSAVYLSVDTWFKK